MKFYFDSRSSENDKGAESIEKIILFHEIKNLILQKLKIYHMYKLICLHSSYYRYACVKVDFKKSHKNLKTETQNEAISYGQPLKSHILKLYTVHIFFALVLCVGKTKNVISRMKNNVHFRGGRMHHI
jgi:hypothetical protein